MFYYDGRTSNSKDVGGHSVQKSVKQHIQKLYPKHMHSTHKEHFRNMVGNRMMQRRYAVVCLLTRLYSGEKSISPMKL